MFPILSRGAIAQHRTFMWALAGLAFLAVPHAAWPTPKGPDLTQNYIRAPNFPGSDVLPTERVPKLLDGLALDPGAVSKAAITFTPGGTTDTRTKLDTQMYYNSIFGDQNRVTGDDGIEGDTASNFTRPRHYDPANRFNVLNFTRSGLNVGTVCSLNNTPAGCTRGHLYGGMIRLPTVILPGDIVSVTMRTGNSPLFYTGVAMYAGVQTTPGPGGRPYEGRGSLHYGACYGEIDGTDNYEEPNVMAGHQLKMGVVPSGSYAENAAGQCYKRAPHEVYDANGRHFIYHPNHGYPFFEIVGAPTYAGMHTYTWWVTNNGSNLVYYFFDGMLVHIQYYESALPFYTDANGARRRIGYSLVIASQTIPVFLNPDHDISTGVYAHIIPNDGGPIVGGPWSATIQAIKIIHGSISPKALAASAVDPNGTDHATYGNLQDYRRP